MSKQTSNRVDVRDFVPCFPVLRFPFHCVFSRPVFTAAAVVGRRATDGVAIAQHDTECHDMVTARLSWVLSIRCCSIRPVQEIGPRPRTRKGDFSVWYNFGKIIKIVATRCHILKLKCTKFYFSWGSAPRDPLAGFKGAYF